jgi:hypothetical protein
LLVLPVSLAWHIPSTVVASTPRRTMSSPALARMRARVAAPRAVIALTALPGRTGGSVADVHDDTMRRRLVATT